MLVLILLAPSNLVSYFFTLEGEYKFLAENEFEVSLTSAEMNFCLDVAVVPDNDHPFLTSNNDPILSSTSTKDPNLTSIIDKTLVSEYAENGTESEGGLCLGLGTSPSRFVRLEMGNEFLVSSPRGLGSTEDSFSTIEQVVLGAGYTQGCILLFIV